MAEATVLVCRGCCCGTAEKHPDVDHDAQLRALAAAAAAGSVRLRVTDCLGYCDRSNVAVVRVGAERLWFGNLLDGAAVAPLATWLAAGAPSPPPGDLDAHRFEPSDGPTVVARPIDVGGARAAALVHDLLAGGGGWSVGVPGAVADSGVTDGAALVRLEGTTVTVTAPTGALRLHLAPPTGLFVLGGPDRVVLVVVAVRRESLPLPASSLTARGRDADAIDGADAAGRLYDLGIGQPSTAFCVRTTDPELTVALDGAASTGWQDLVESDAGRLLLRRSPARVIESGCGRAEVTSPIPPADGESPAGVHTHLDPGLLEVGAELPAGIALPSGWAPGALLQPPPGWRLDV
jgi:hypothetical protein